jgi:hypothetical protein
MGNLPSARLLWNALMQILQTGKRFKEIDINY